MEWNSGILELSSALPASCVCVCGYLPCGYRVSCTCSCACSCSGDNECVCLLLYLGRLPCRCGFGKREYILFKLHSKTRKRRRRRHEKLAMKTLPSELEETDSSLRCSLCFILAGPWQQKNRAESGTVLLRIVINAYWMFSTFFFFLFFHFAWNLYTHPLPLFLLGERMDPPPINSPRGWIHASLTQSKLWS